MTSRREQHFAIEIAAGDGQCPTWCLIELQGELEVQEEVTSATFPVGTLCQSSFVSCTAVQGPVLLHAKQRTHLGSLLGVIIEASV